MIFKSHNNILFFLLALTLGASATAKEVTVAFGQFQPPYVMHQEHNVHPSSDSTHMHGIEIDIFSAALRLSGHTLKTQIMNKTEIKWSLKTNRNIDAGSAISPGRSTDQFYYSDKLIEHTPFAITKKNKNIVLNSFDDLKNYKVAVRSGSNMALGNSFANKIYQNKKDNKFANQLHQNIAFWSDKADVIIVDRYIFNYYKNMLANEFDTLSQAVEFNDLFSKKIPYYAAFKDKNLRDQFNSALETLKKSVEYQAIISRYIKL